MMESEVGRSTTTTFRSGSSLCDVLLGEYHSRPEDYKDVRIRFEDGSTLESCRLLLGCLSEVLFDSLGSIPPWEDAEILVPGLNPLSTRCFLQRLLQMPSVEDTTSNQVQGEEEQEIIRAFGFDVPPRLERRLRAYHCEDCDVFCPRDGILSHVRDCHPLSRKALSSPIWSFFEATEHPDFHLCRECKSVIKDKSQSTLTLIRHLEVQHPDSYEEYLIQGGSVSSGRGDEPPLPSSQTNTERRGSVIWKYFRQDPSSEENMSHCNACGRGFKVHKGMTSSMIRHLKVKHADLYGDYAQSTLMMATGDDNECLLFEDDPMLDDEGGDGSSLLPSEELVAVSTNMPEAGEEAAAARRENNILKGTLSAYFEKRADDDGKEVSCKSCADTFSLGSSSGELIQHLKAQHPGLYQEGFGREDLSHQEDEDEEWRLEDAGNEEEDSEDAEDSIVLNTPKKSIAWDYFEPTGLPDANACKLCSRVLKCKKKNTSTMLRHLRRTHPEVFLDVDRRARPLEVELTTLEEEEMIVDGEGFNEEYEYFVDFFIPTEDDVALLECKLCLKVFREENVEGQICHMKGEHPQVYEDVSSSRKEEEDDDNDSEYEYEEEEEQQTQKQLAAKAALSKIKKRSLIWNYFDTTPTPGINSCMLCLKTFKCKGQTTSSMIRHLKSDHGEVYEEFTSLTASIYGRKIGESFQKFVPSLGGEGSSSASSGIKTEPEFQHQDLEEDEAKKLFKRRSSIWNYFDPTETPETNACKMCKKEFKCKGRTTSSMIRHLKKVHMESFKEFLRFRNVHQDFYIKLEEKPRISKASGGELIFKYFLRPSAAPEWRECRDCGKRVTKIPGKKGLAILVRHMDENHPEDYEAYLSQGGLPVPEDSGKVCAECGEKFPHRGALTQHMKIAHASSCPYKCEICNASFTRRESFEQHSHDKNKPRNFLCTICGKTFARRSIRNFHEKAHKGDKKYECSYCPKKFLTNQRKYKHERTHTGEKPYQCTECGRQFTQSHHLVTHARIHTGQKPYTCNFCPQTFRHLSSRNNHKCEGKMRGGAPPPNQAPQPVVPSSNNN